MVNVGNGLVLPEIALEIDDYLNGMGMVYRATIYPVALASAGDYVWLSLVTPGFDVGETVYQLATFSKTGDELQAELIIDPTLTGGSAMSLVPLNHNFLGEPAPFTSPLWGASASGATLSGGTVLPGAFIAGTGTGATQAGGLSAQASIVFFKPSTRYALKVTALGSNTKVAVWFNIACIRRKG